MQNIDPPSVFQNNLHWGVHHQIKIPFKKPTVYSCFPINKSEIIAITSNSIIRLEKSTIKESAPLSLSTAIFIEQQNVIVGVSSTTSEFFFIRPYDLAHHISTNVRTKQVPTFHILYSPKSSLLITAGKNIKVWNLKCIMPSHNVISVPPIIEITLRNVFDSSFEVDLLNPPLFDFQRELLVLPESTGFNAYDMDCKFVKQMTKLSASPRTAAAISKDSSNIITFDPKTGGAYEWNINGTLLRNQTIGNSAIVSCRYLNEFFVIFLDSKNNIYLYDTQTLRLFLCDQLSEKPSSIFLYYTSTSFFPTFSICYDNSIDFYEVVMPWKLWMSTVPKPHMIKICRKRKKAARLLIHTDNEYVYFISPKTQKTLTSSTTSSPAKISDIHYDRGMESSENRDQLFMAVYDTNLTISSTSTVPCTEITAIDMKIASVFECDMDKIHYYGVATSNGELVIHDYNTFEPVKRYIVAVAKVLSAKYDSKYGTVLFFYEHEIIRFDITTGNVHSHIDLNTNQEAGTIFDFKDELALVGYKSGKISIILCNKTGMVNLSHESCVFHSLEVTGFSINTNFFISVSLDQQMKFWSFNGSNILTLTLPLPLYSVEVINGKRDIVVGTDRDLMFIEGRTLFCEKFEPKDDIIDNYNEKDDSLLDDCISPLQIQEMQKQALRSAMKENEDNQGNNHNNRRYPTFRKKKKEIDEETRRKILEKMLKMGDDPFTINRIREREKRRFEEEKNKIQSDVDRERLKRQAEKEKEEEEEEKRKKAILKEAEKLIQDEDNQADKGKEKEKEEEEQNEESKKKKNDQEEQEGEDEDEKSNNKNNNNGNLNEDFYSKSGDNDPLSYLQDSKESPRAKKVAKKKKKKKNNRTGLVYVDENGNRFTQLKYGDWVDSNGKVFRKNGAGTFVADDGTVWGGPDKNKGRFETAERGQIEGEIQPEGTVWISPDGKEYRSLGDGRWVGPDGEIYTMNGDGTFVSSDGKKWNGPVGQIGTEIWIGPDGKVYHRQSDGTYVAEDGTVWKGPMDGSSGGYFGSPDGSRPGDTFVDAQGNVFTRTNDGWIGPDGKLYRLGKDGKFVADDGSVLDTSKGQLFRHDDYDSDAVYVAPDGSVFRRTESNRGWIGPDGKVYRLNKDGLYVADDGTVMPLSNERLVWIDNEGIMYRPTYSRMEWLSSSDGKKYEYERLEDGHKFVCSIDGSVWSGPTAGGGRFAGRDLFDTPIQWVDFSGTVYRPISSNGSLWVSSLHQNFERQQNGEFIEKAESGEVKKWEGPGKPSNGNWVNQKGQIIEALGGYWISPDNKIYTATKGGYITINCELYKPSSHSETFFTLNGLKWNGLGQIISSDPQANGSWIEANGDVYRPIDSNGNWQGPDGEIYSPTIEGHWVGQTSGKIWKGPPFFSARKYFVKDYRFMSFHSPNRILCTFDGTTLGQRPSTPLYKVPPLLYPPFKSRFKAFQTRPPPKRKPRVIYQPPPPNIVCDPSQIVKLIIDGNTQLIPVAKRLGLDRGSAELQEAIERYESQHPQQPLKPSKPPAVSRSSEPMLYRQYQKSKQTPSNQDQKQPQSPDKSRPSSESLFGQTPAILAPNSLSQLPRLNLRREISHEMSEGELIRLPPAFQRHSETPRNRHFAPPTFVPQPQNSIRKPNQIPPAQLPPVPPQRDRMPLIPLDGNEDDDQNSPEMVNLTDQPNKLYQLLDSEDNRKDSNWDERSNDKDDSNVIVKRSDGILSNNMKNDDINKNSDLNQGGINDGWRGATRVDDLDKKFNRPVPLLSFKQMKDPTPATAIPKTERNVKRRLHTAFFTRPYQAQLDKQQNQTSRDLVNPLIVRSMLKPKLSIPQQLFKPKRNY